MNETAAYLEPLLVEPPTGPGAVPACDALGCLGMGFYLVGDYDASVRWLDAALGVRPHETAPEDSRRLARQLMGSTHRHRGRALHARGQPDEAIADYHRALEFFRAASGGGADRTDVLDVIGSTQIELASAAADLARWDDASDAAAAAIASYRTLLERDPANRHVRINAAEAHLGAAQVEHAAARANPTVARRHEKLATTRTYCEAGLAIVRIAAEQADFAKTESALQQELASIEAEIGREVLHASPIP